MKKLSGLRGRMGAILAGLVPLGALAATPNVDLGLQVSSFDCHGTRDRFSYVATWTDRVLSDVYNVKLGNACTLDGQPCTTNARQSCTARCTKGRCRAAFTSCRTGRAGYLYVVAANGKGVQERRYPAPDCR